MMVNTCKHCGDIVPVEEVCPHCNNLGIVCPECGNILKVMSTCTMVSEKEIALCSIYHCNNCHSDWERKSNYVGQPVEFQRKYWG